MKRLWWSVCAAVQGLSYDEYIRKKLRTLECELAELPDTPNYLTAIREYYGFKSSRRTWEVLRLVLALSIPASMIIFFLPGHASIGVGLLAGLWFSQLMLVAVGVFVNRRYP